MLACDLGMVGHSREDEGVFHYFIISFFFFFQFQKQSKKHLCNKYFRPSKDSFTTYPQVLLQGM